MFRYRQGLIAILSLIFYDQISFHFTTYMTVTVYKNVYILGILLNSMAHRDFGDIYWIIYNNYILQIVKKRANYNKHYNNLKTLKLFVPPPPPPFSKNSEVYDPPLLLNC